MATRESTFNVRAVPRRTILKTAAWSVPVIAVAAATPLAAASVAADLQLTPDPRGDTLHGVSPDGLQSYDLSVVASFSATTLGASPTPAGSVVTLTFDSRLFSGPWLTLDTYGGTIVSVASSTTAGNVTTASFTLPVAVPAGTGLTFWPHFAPPAGSTPPWYTDLNGYSVSIAPPAGVTDPVLGNNTVTSNPVYS
ncbi:hypothetical protein SAMN04488591_1663 [Microbacterium azadirachtae]|uniref:Uncharacterized protein n=1 Tax=Microbacterium azadirachtae TaxID=582680 RepID=A0A1I6HBB0_9MICO|nr:hypothetical protein [Microbacterium azadirachtae]SFR51742.1 hypothetical protein SAMN04488591_1663 [Microbacterium azadirachtae]